MTAKRKCPKCGAEQTSSAMQGLCPDCVIKVTLGPLSEDAPAPHSASRLRYFGDYELLEEIAHGGMGVVWRARQISLNRLVAVKMIRAGLLAGDTEVRRFHAEAEASASLDHPNIVPLYEVGEHAGQQYFSMKLITGLSLAAGMQAGCWSKAHCPDHRSGMAFIPGRLRCCASAARLLAKVSRAVHHAHQRGILHRDLKPGNILVDAQGEPHVTDFGLAKVLTEDTQLSTRNPQLTLSGAVLGTPSYMAPEQAAGKTHTLTTAADIYSLGAILYEMLAGQPPFKAATPLETLRLVTEQEPARPKSLNAFVDPDLETICLKCLEKDPQHRYGSAQALAEDLERWLRYEPILARRSTALERVMKWTQRHPARAATVAVFHLVLLIGAGGVLWEWREANHQRGLAEAALQQSQNSLWRANFDRAHALRTSGQMGQRVEALKAIHAAAAIRPTAELGNEAIAAMALTDLEDVGVWLPSPTNLVSFTTAGSGEWVAFSLPGGVIEVRRFPDGKLEASFNSGQQRPNLRLDDAGGRLLTGDYDGSRVWDLRTTNLLCEVRTPDLLEGYRTYRMFGGIDAALSADGRWLAYPDSTSSVAWRAIGTDRSLGRLSFESSSGSLAFSSSGAMLAVCTEKGTEVWRLPDQTHLATLKAGGYPLVWHPTDPILAMGYGTEVGVCGLATNESQRLTGHHMDGVFPFWHPDGNLLASVSWDHVLRLWDSFGGVQLLETTYGQPSGFSTDGQWLMVDNERGIGRLKVHLPEECRLFHAPLGTGQNFGVVFSPDDRFVAGLAGDELWIWEVASGRRVAHQPMPGQSWLEFTSQRSLVATGAEGVLLWTNTAAGDDWALALQTVMVPPGDGRIGWWSSFDSARTQLAVKRGATGEVYDFPSGRLRLKLAGQRLFAGALFTPDGRWLASNYWDNNGRRSSEFWIWSAEDGQPVRKIPNGNGGPVFSPDGRWLLLASEKDYAQYAIRGHPTNWAVVRHFTRQSSGFNGGGAAFSADSKLLALHADQRIFRLLEADTGRELARLTPLPDAFRTGSPSFSHNGRWFVSGSAIGLHVWDLQLILQRLREMGLDWK